jgi:hypothetical protein
MSKSLLECDLVVLRPVVGFKTERRRRHQVWTLDPNSARGGITARHMMKRAER